MSTPDFDIVYFSQLRWHEEQSQSHELMAAIARDHRVLWVEEPRLEIGAPGNAFDVAEEAFHIHVGRLVYRSDAPLFWKRLTTVTNEQDQVVCSPDVSVAHLSSEPLSRPYSAGAGYFFPSQSFQAACRSRV